MSLRVMLKYQAALAALAAALVVLSVPYGLGSPLPVAALAVVAVLAERGRVRLNAVTEVSISMLPAVFAAAVFSPAAAMIVAVVSFANDFPLEYLGPKDRSANRSASPLLRWGVYSCVRAIYGAAAGFAALAVGHFVEAGATRLIIATACAALVAEPLDLAFNALTLRLRGDRALQMLRMAAPMVLANVSLYTPIVAGLTVAYTHVSPWTLPLFFVPALAAQRLFGLYQEQLHLTSRLVDANADLERANLSFATALVTTLDARDQYTAGHSAAVAIYARDIALRMGLGDEIADKAHLAGLVHDIGKIGLSPGVLEKPGALTLEERREMQRHSEIGERILMKVESYAEIATIVRHHHERVDGGGYPDGLTYPDIPEISRIIAVADAYNAMTSNRPYRDAMPSRVARLRLAQAVESQFDTSVVAAFEAVLAGATEDYRMAQSDEFSFEWQETVAEAFDATLTAPGVSVAISA